MKEVIFWLFFWPLAVFELLHVKQTKNWVMNVYRSGVHIVVFRMVNVHLPLDTRSAINDIREAGV